LNGSILELLVAVPSHINRAAAGQLLRSVGTFWGIVTGLSIMLLAFAGCFLSLRRAVPAFASAG